MVDGLGGVDVSRGPEAAVPKAWPVLGDAADAGVDESHGTHDAGLVREKKVEARA